MSTLHVRVFQRENSLSDNTRLPLIDDGIGFDFDHHVGVNEARENHGRGGQNVAENFTMGTADSLPQRGIAHEHAGAHDMARLGSCFTKRMDDDLEATFGLCIRIAGRDDIAVITDRRRTGHKYLVAGAHGA